MSLRDTINGAVKEAQENRVFTAKDKDKDLEPAAKAKADKGKGRKSILSPEETETRSQGFSKRSVSRAKPAREAASMVRTAGNGKTKEQRKADQNHKQELSERRADASREILKGHASYKRRTRTWWAIMIVAVICAAGSFAASYLLRDAKGGATTNGTIIGLILTGIAAVLLIVSIFYDRRMVSPLRKSAEEEVARMSDKRVKQYLIEVDRENERRRAEAKEAKNARRSAPKRHEQHR